MFLKKCLECANESILWKNIDLLSDCKKINTVNAVRTVASANAANSISLIIPCHRIIGSDGRLVGYGGGLSVKKRLLELEKTNCFSTNTEETYNENIQPTQKNLAFSVG